MPLSSLFKQLRRIPRQNRIASSGLLLILFNINRNSIEGTNDAENEDVLDYQAVLSASLAGHFLFQCFNKIKIHVLDLFVLNRLPLKGGHFCIVPPTTLECCYLWCNTGGHCWFSKNRAESCHRPKRVKRWTEPNLRNHQFWKEQRNYHLDILASSKKCSHHMLLEASGWQGLPSSGILL